MQADLGAGSQLEGGVRTRMESAFGRGFGDVRVHADSQSAGVAARLSSRAFTVGAHVAFGSGHYRPGTIAGDVLIAHELAHVTQQAGTSSPSSHAGGTTALEDDANRAAVRAVGRGGLAHRLLRTGPVPTRHAALAREATTGGPARPALGTGLRLQRCNGDGHDLGPAPTTFEEASTADVGAEPDAPARSPAIPPPADTQVPDVQGVPWEEITTSAAALLILGKAEGSTENRLFVLPARGLAWLPPAPTTTATPTAPAPATPPPQRGGPVVTLPAVGHAGVALVRTGHGTGMLIDAGGTRGGQPGLMTATGVAALQARHGITNIQGAIITHTHADHVAGLTTLIQRGQLTGAQVWVYPGWETARVGPLGQALQALASGQAQTLQTRRVGVPGQTVTRARLVVGNATLEMVTDTRKLQQFNQRLAAGRWRGSRGATQVADPASMFTRVSFGTGMPTVLWGGDLRGRDFARLARVMGDTAFNDFVRGVNVISGFHHLGAVDSRDVAGLRRLIAARGTLEPFTVVAQVGAKGEINRELVSALQVAGARVLATGEADPSRLGTITVRAGGAVQGQFAHEFAVDPVTQQAHTRIEQMNRAIAVLEVLPEYRQRADLSPAAIRDGLRTEVTRLQTALRDRSDLAFQRLRSTARTTASEQRMQTLTQQLQVTHGMEQQLGAEPLSRLARTTAERTELATELRTARQSGVASERLRQLIVQADPATARQILLDELGKPMSRRERRYAWQRAMTRLNRQAELNAIARGGAPVGPRARGAAWFGLFMEAWNIAAPFITESVRSSQDQGREDFYRAFRDLVWWTDKGIAPVVRGESENGSALDADAELMAGIERRLHRDLPSDEARARIPLSPAAVAASPLRTLYIPEMNEWEAAARERFWTAFMLWVSAHVRNFDDYSEEFKEGLPPPVRQRPGDSRSFGDRGWEIRVGVPDGGHIAERWQASEDLTRIMNATVRRVLLGTEADIARRWEERTEPTSDTPSVSAPGAPPQRGSADQPSFRAYLKGRRATIYQQAPGRSPERISHMTFQFWTDRPLVFVYMNRNAPSGKKWVSGADYNTYAGLRSLTVWNWVAQIRVPRHPKILDPNDPNFMRRQEPEEYLSREEAAALRLAQSHDPRAKVEWLSEDESRMYQAQVTIYERGPNYSGHVLVDSDDIDTSTSPPSP